MSRRMSRRVGTGAAALLVGFVGGVHLHDAVAPAAPAGADRAIDPSARRAAVDPEDCPPLATAPPYPVNDNGMSYGSGAGIDEDDPGPDLVAAHGTDGRCGFIRSADRDRGARTLASALVAPDPEGRDVPLYAVDGVTVIGSFHVGPGRVVTSGAPEPPPSTP